MSTLPKPIITHQHKYAFFSSLLLGVITNLYIFTNKISFHDDIDCLFSVGSTYSSGRWFLGVLGSLIKRLYGNYSTPVLEGLITILCIAISSAILVEIFEIHSILNCILAGGIMAVFPSVFATFAYMFTAAYYYTAVLITCISVYIIKSHKISLLFIGGGGISCALGIYQAFFPMAVALLLGLVIIKTLSDNTSNIDIIKIGFIYIGILIISLIFYFMATKLFCLLLHIPLSDYKGINNMGNLSLQQLPGLIANAYKGWFLLCFNITSLSCSQFAIILYRLFSAIFCLTALFYFCKTWRKNKIKSFLLAAQFIIFPLAANLIYVMSPQGVHILMTYGFVISFLLLISLSEKLITESKNLFISSRLKLGSVIYKWSTVIVISGIISIYIQYANVEYLRAEFLQAQAQSYYTTLITQIKSTNGYQADMPIVFIGDNSDTALDKTFIRSEYNTGVFPEDLKTLLHDYRWKEYMMRWCGFAPSIRSEMDYKDLPEVQQMNTYPQNGSIRIVDDVVLIKLS